MKIKGQEMHKDRCLASESAYLIQDAPILGQVALQVHIEQLHVAPAAIEHKRAHLRASQGRTPVKDLSRDRSYFKVVMCLRH